MIEPKPNGTAIVQQEISREPEKSKILQRFPRYGSIDANVSGDTCPTCRGTGRIPRGQEDQLVAVIPCNDKRLKPRHTTLYVFLATGLCVLTCTLVLFFLFPRSVVLRPVSVQSVLVFFKPDATSIDVTNIIEISNNNYVPVQVIQFNMQGLISRAVAGTTKITNMTAIQARSELSTTIQINLLIKDTGLNDYCKSPSIKIHTLFVELQMTMNISYLSHSEQLSVDTFEYIDCGTNSTVPHPVR